MSNALTVGSLCTGAGGLDLAAADTLVTARTAWVAENDPDASTVLRARFGTPNLGDISAVDWSSVEVRHAEPRRHQRRRLVVG